MYHVPLNRVVSYHEQRGKHVMLRSCRVQEMPLAFLIVVHIHFMKDVHMHVIVAACREGSVYDAFCKLSHDLIRLQRYVSGYEVFDVSLPQTFHKDKSLS